MPGRKYSSASANYRYGFNGKELDKEVSGTTTYDYGFRIYSPALGRFLSVDPLTKKYPWYTPYQFAGNMPIRYIDLDGLEPANNPKPGGIKEVAAKTIVKEISIGTSLNNAIENPETLNPLKIGDQLDLKGEMRYRGNPNYTTDTRKDKADKFNLYVSNKSIYKVDESNSKNFSDYEAFVVNELMQNFVSGKGPENYDFPTNGVISSKFLKSDIVQAALSDFKAGKTVNNKQYNFGFTDLVKDTYRNGSPFSITGLTGSGTILINETSEGIFINIFNITSLTSGAFGKEFFGEKNYPKSSVRDPENGRTPFGNISQNFSLFIPNDK